MIVVDSSVWIDYFTGVVTKKTDTPDKTLGQRLVASGDLILTEALQGFRHDQDYKTADVIIASFCIERKLPLLFSDKDFKPFVKYLGLREG